MAICPTGALEISGRELSKDDLFDLPPEKYANKEGLFVIFGYPSVKYKKGIKRTFASTTIMK